MFGGEEVQGFARAGETVPAGTPGVFAARSDAVSGRRTAMQCRMPFGSELGVSGASQSTEAHRAVPSNAGRPRLSTLSSMLTSRPVRPLVSK
jgi:hypothetical protein